MPEYVDNADFIAERRKGIVFQLRKIEEWARRAAEWEEQMSKEGDNINWVLDRLEAADQQVVLLTQQLATSQKDTVDTAAEARLQAFRDENPDTTTTAAEIPTATPTATATGSTTAPEITIPVG